MSEGPQLLHNLLKLIIILGSDLIRDAGPCGTWNNWQFDFVQILSHAIFP